MIIFLYAKSSFYAVDLPRFVSHPLDTEDVTEEVLLRLGQLLHASLQKGQVLLLELLHLLAEEGELVQVLEVVFEHYNGVRVLLVLLIFFLVEVALSFGGSYLEHGDDRVQDLREPAIDEAALRQHQ